MSTTFTSIKYLYATSNDNIQLSTNKYDAWFGDICMTRMKENNKQHFFYFYENVVNEKMCQKEKLGKQNGNTK